MEENSKKVLIIDDDVEFAQKFSDRVKAAGLTPVVAVTGKEALNYLKTNDVSFIVLDFVMPEMDGATFYHTLTHDMRKNIPTIVLTNLPAAKEGQELEVFIKNETNFDDLISKIKNRVSQDA